MTDLLPFVADLPLVDHHCHGVVTRDVPRADFEAMLTEADAPSPLGTSLFDSLIGLAVRARCAPQLKPRTSTPPTPSLSSPLTAQSR